MLKPRMWDLDSQCIIYENGKGVLGGLHMGVANVLGLQGHIVPASLLTF